MSLLRLMIPLIAIAMLFSSVGVMSAQMTNTVSEILNAAADGDAMQQPPSEKQVGDRKGYSGVFSLPVEGAKVFILTPKAGDPVEISIPDGDIEDITRTPGGHVAGTLVDGAEIAVLGEFVSDGVNVVPEARRIVVKPVPQTPTVGAVASVETDDEGVRTLTIVRPDGTIKEVRLGAGVESPAIGEIVTTFRGRSGNGPSEGDDGGPPTVKGLVRAAEVHQRIQGFLEDLTAGNGDLPAAAAERRAQRLVKLAAVLEDHANRNVDILERLSQRQDLNPRALQGLAGALERATAARAEAREARDSAGPGRQDQDRGSGGNPR